MHTEVGPSEVMGVRGLPNVEASDGEALAAALVTGTAAAWADLSAGPSVAVSAGLLELVGSSVGCS